MKQFYFTLLFFIGFSFFISAQDMGGTPVEGLIPIKRMDESEKSLTTKTTALSSNLNAKMLSTNAVTPTGNSSEVGITEGALSVSLSGAATYNVPIMVPPGINGVVPQVSLAYSSQGGNGMAGYGWNIAGVSSITRIPATKYHDGVIDGVDFDSHDRFSLDGQRLIAKTGTYGANGTVYETENFSNVKITSYGVHTSGTNYGPAYFLVEYPDGSKGYYGNSSDSRSITEWSITYWENPQGVRISYTYNSENNNINIASINYGTVGSTTSINKIQFNYNTANRTEEFYIGGQKILQNKILNNIVVTANNVGYRNYQLAYNINSLGYQRLISVTEKSGDGTKSYNPTVFTYEDTSNSISYLDIATKLSVGNITSLNAETVSGDFSGDEKMEFLLYPTNGTDNKKKYWFYPDLGANGYANIGYVHKVGAFEAIFPVTWLSWNNHLMPKQGWTVVKANSATPETTFVTYSSTITNPILLQYEKKYTFPKMTETYYYYCNPRLPDNPREQPELPYYDGIKLPVGVERRTIIENIPKNYLSGDFNGDGLTDIVAVEKAVNYTIQTRCSTYSSETYNGGKTYFINLDRRLTSNYVNESGYIQYTSSSSYYVADFNGDGKSDIYVFDTGRVRIYSLNDSNKFDLISDFVDGNVSVDNTKTILLGDYNGDGKTDFIIPNGYGSSTWYKYTSTGTGFTKSAPSSSVVFFQNSPTTTFNYIASDYDKDGKSDIILTKSNRNSGNTQGNLTITAYKNLNGTFGSNSITNSSPYSSDIYLNALPIYLPTGKGIQSKDKPYNPTLEIAFLSNNKIFYFNSKKDNTQDQSCPK